MGESKRYWFPRKAFGWGWGLPCAWQGWVVYALWLAVFIALHFVFPPTTHLTAFLVGVFASVAALVVVCWLKGEPPGGWHRGG